MARSGCSENKSGRIVLYPMEFSHKPFCESHKMSNSEVKIYSKHSIRLLVVVIGLLMVVIDSLW